MFQACHQCELLAEKVASLTLHPRRPRRAGAKHAYNLCGCDTADCAECPHQSMRILCTDRTCSKTDTCRNRLLPDNATYAFCDSISPPVDVRVTSNGTGEGLFATRAISQDEAIATYTGEWVTERPANPYTLRFDERWYVDASDKSRSGIARYVNHSCRPNAVMYALVLPPEERQQESLPPGALVLFALRDIRPNEEITFDYGDEYVDNNAQPIVCLCDARPDLHYIGQGKNVQP